MKFITLFENSKKDEKLKYGHGLSIYIEALNKKILMDTGKDGSFIENARLMGIDIKSVDFAVISHFHYDHAGGLLDFMTENKTAKVYMSKASFDEYYVKKDGEMEYFGLYNNRYDMSRIVLIDEKAEIVDGIRILSKLNYNFDNHLNDKFYKKVEVEYIKDDFSHEIALIITEGNNNILFSGCFHSGVVNTVKKANESGDEITHVVGGFHLSGSIVKIASDEYFDKLVNFLKEKKITGYTGHCTGKYFLKELEKKLSGTVFPIFTGAYYII